MLFLLETKKFEQFNKVMAHAKKVMDRSELETVTKLHDEFKMAIDGSAEGKMLPEDELASQNKALDVNKVRSVLKKAMTIKQPADQLEVIQEEK